MVNYTFHTYIMHNTTPITKESTSLDQRPLKPPAAYEFSFTNKILSSN